MSGAVRLFHPCALKLFPSVPARRLFQMDFDCLLCLGNVVPAAVRFPAVRNYLNQYSSGRSFRNVRGAVAIGLHVQLNLLVFSQLVLFDVFQIHAGVFNGRAFLSARHFNRYPRHQIRFAGARFGVRLRRSLRPQAAAECNGGKRNPNCHFDLWFHVGTQATAMQSILYGLLLQVKSATTLFDADLRLRAAETRVAAACRERILPGRVSFPSAAIWERSTIGKLSQNLFVAWIDWRAMLLYLF